MIPLRSILFDILFFAYHLLACVLCLPMLLAGRQRIFDFIHAYVSVIYWLEKHVIGLDYEVRGAEHLPASGGYIVAAKHQSAYETFKLHILWRDPAVILKRELIRVPLWGRFLARSEPIAIDRGNARQSLRQLAEGARRIAAENRVLVIFPQGTRVPPGMGVDQRPYRVGIGQMRDASGLPVISLALNSGLFWPRKGWKMPGRVIFEFLPPHPATGDQKADMLALQQTLEAASQALEAEALRTDPRLRSNFVHAIAKD